jgi:hypothetical protein
MTIFAHNFDILEFWGYPSFQQNIIAEYDEFNHRGDKSVKRFFDEILKTAEKLFDKKNLMDNKVVFKLQLKGTTTIIYCGYKDNMYRISLSANSESLRKLKLV